MTMKDTAVLLIDCPDRKGLVARVSGLLYEHGANILHADQHQDHDLGKFFMRVEWSLNAGGSGDASSSSSGFDLVKFSKAFTPIAAELGMHWQIGVMNLPTRVALFCSQYLHCVADLLHRWQSRELHCEIRVIVSNHREVEKLAAYHGIPFEHVAASAAMRAEAEGRQLRILEQYGIELVVLARYMQILSPDFVAKYPAAIINVHHSFLPAFIGAKPYHAAHARGVKLIGATSHYVTAELDAGPIIEQEVIRVDHRRTAEQFVQMGRDVEGRTLAQAVQWHAEHRVLLDGTRTVVFN